jgi:hypothetical protein
MGGIRKRITRGSFGDPRWSSRLTGRHRHRPSGSFWQMLPLKVQPANDAFWSTAAGDESRIVGTFPPFAHGKSQARYRQNPTFENWVFLQHGMRKPAVGQVAVTNRCQLPVPAVLVDTLATTHLEITYVVEDAEAS